MSTAPGTMRHLSNCCILTILLSIAVAAYTPGYASLSTFHQLQTPSRTRSVFSRLRDGLIRSVWSIPSCTGEGGASNDVKSASPPPSTLLARYGGDVVLRFSINSPEEAAALTEAVHVLFLDVWEFNADWVDIRLAKEVVRLHLTPGWRNRYLCQSRYRLSYLPIGIVVCMWTLLMDPSIGAILTWPATTIPSACPHSPDARPGPSHL